MTGMGPSAIQVHGARSLADREPIRACRPWFRQQLTPLRCFLALLVFFLTQCVSGAQDSHSPPERPSEEFTLTINANMVLLSATVLDRHNALVSGLVQDDFRVYEDGVLQPLRFFSHEDIPVTAGILVDNSASMGSKRSDVIASAMAFARSSNPQDQMFVVHFSDRVSFGLAAGTQFTDRPEMLLAALSNIHAAGQTALYDGIAAGLEHLKRGKSEKKVLILIADGDDNASKSSLAQIIEMAKQSSAIIYAIGIFDEQDGDQKPGVLKRLARETGGEAFFPESSSELGVICKEIARDIRNQYMLAYVPRTEEKAGSYRTIEVKASAPHHGSLHVRTRAGYTVSAAPPAAAKETVHDTRQ